MANGTVPEGPLAAHWLPVLMVETSYNSCVVVLAGL